MSHTISPPAAPEFSFRIDDASRERVARVLWDDAMSDMTPEWRDMAWADMGGSEPSQERVDYFLLADTVLRSLSGVES